MAAFSIPENLPRPAEKYPFTPGQRVYYMPAPRWKAPWPRITATVATRGDSHDVRILHDGKARTSKVSGCGVAYMGYCERCEVPAVQDGEQLVCPSCAQPATPVPPPDHLVVRWYPIDKWTRPMAMHRAILHPEWSATEAWNDGVATVEARYRAMLDRLGLAHRDQRSTDDFHGWRRDYDHARLLTFYAMLECAEGFQAVYAALVDDQKDVPNNCIPEIPNLGLPEPATGYPFQPGEAVWYVSEPRTSSNEPPTLIPAIVLAPAKDGKYARVAIWRDDQKRTFVQGSNLTYRGYCAFCGVPAVLSQERLICPQCGDDATAVPPPAELVLRWYPLGSEMHPLAVRACVLTGCSWNDGLDTPRALHQQGWTLIQKHGMEYDRQHNKGPWAFRNENGYGYFEGRMKWYSQLGDEESFLAYYKAYGGEPPATRVDRIIAFLEHLLGDDQPGPSRRLELPPLDIERSAEDSTPDGADDLTAWLVRQFRRAA